LRQNLTYLVQRAIIPSTQSRHTYLVQRAVRKLDQRCCAAAVAQWAESLRVARLVRRIGSHMMQRELAGAFHGWAERAAEARRSRAVLQRVGARLRNGLLVAAWEMWEHEVHDVKHLQAVGENVMRKFLQRNQVGFVKRRAWLPPRLTRVHVGHRQLAGMLTLLAKSNH
jgi:hypothetical protein